MVGVDVAVVTRLGLEHIDVTERLAVLDEAVDAEGTFCVAVEDDVAPDNRVRLLLVRRGESGLVHHDRTLSIHFVVGLESHITVTAKSEDAGVSGNGRQRTDCERNITANILCKTLTGNRLLRTACAQQTETEQYKKNLSFSIKPPKTYLYQSYHKLTAFSKA